MLCASLRQLPVVGHADHRAARTWYKLAFRRGSCFGRSWCCSWAASRVALVQGIDQLGRNRLLAAAATDATDVVGSAQRLEREHEREMVEAALASSADAQPPDCGSPGKVPSSRLAAPHGLMRSLYRLVGAIAMSLVALSTLCALPARARCEWNVCEKEGRHVRSSRVKTQHGSVAQTRP
jgi:hypothetical protein